MVSTKMRDYVSKLWTYILVLVLGAPLNIFALTAASLAVTSRILVSLSFIWGAEELMMRIFSGSKLYEDAGYCYLLPVLDRTMILQMKETWSGADHSISGFAAEYRRCFQAVESDPDQKSLPYFVIKGAWNVPMLRSSETCFCLINVLGGPRVLCSYFQLQRSRFCLLLMWCRAENGREGKKAKG